MDNCLHMSLRPEQDRMVRIAFRAARVCVSCTIWFVSIERRRMHPGHLLVFRMVSMHLCLLYAVCAFPT